MTVTVLTLVIHVKASSIRTVIIVLKCCSCSHMDFKWCFAYLRWEDVGSLWWLKIHVVYWEKINYLVCCHHCLVCFRTLQLLFTQSLCSFCTFSVEHGSCSWGVARLQILVQEQNFDFKVTGLGLILRLVILWRGDECPGLDDECTVLPGFDRSLWRSSKMFQFNLSQCWDINSSKWCGCFGTSCLTL